MGDRMDETENNEFTPMFMKTVPQSDTAIRWREIVRCVNEGMWQFPPHQRGVIWAKEKQRRWIKRLDSDVLPLGSVATYQIAGQGVVWVNDGRQRIRAGIEFLSRPEEFGHCVGDAANILRSVHFPVQHRHYPDLDTAYRDFQLINQGMAMTGKEFYHGVLAYMPLYDMHWKEKLENFQRVVSDNAIKVVSKKRTQRVGEHKHIRHNYAMMLRFLSKEKGLTALKVSLSDCTDVNPDDRNVIEWHLRNQIQRGEASGIDGELDKLNILVARETATINTLWNRIQESPAKDKEKGIALGLYRFLIEASIWKRNNRIPNAKWEEYIEAMLRATEGETHIQEEEGGAQRKRKLCIIGLGKMDLIRKTGTIIGVPLADIASRRRSKRDPRIRQGYDQSHKEPFATNGDGPTIVEPASINRARGAKPIAPKSS